MGNLIINRNLLGLLDLVGLSANLIIQETPYGS